MELRDTGGDGPPVVFLHGALVDGTLWDAVVALLPGSPLHRADAAARLAHACRWPTARR